MNNKSLRTFGLVIAMMATTSCAGTPVKEPEGPPPPQNLLGSTDELQLVTELSYEQAKRYGGHRVLVVLEIDGTLLASDQQDPCGSAQSTMQPVQADAAEQVQRMQDAGLKVIALTSRRPDCHARTLEQLNHNSISFEDSAWPPQEGLPEAFLAEGAAQVMAYENGVIFSLEQDKGLILKAFLGKSDEPLPTLIVMVDSEQSNLNSVMKKFSRTETKVHAWRYTR
ncbi:MAG: DUF2608 domain-containing protein [Gammaproteobacteria bacterium]|jgi:hypothetical protein|nr:DUF2608 domain-containing protein [Gammaproteobacteria bacterium]